MKSFDFLKLISNIGKYVPGTSKLGGPLASKKICEAIDYLYRGKLSPQHYTGGTLVLSIVIFVFSSTIFGQFLNIFSVIILSLSLAIFSVLFLLNIALSKYLGELGSIERITPYVLEELVTIFLTTGTVFEAIQYVAKGDYGVISSKFAQMIEPLNLGVPPELLLSDFALKQPSPTFRRGLLAFKHFIETKDKGIESVLVDSHENLQRRFEQLTLQWENRMMVYASVLVFLPIIFILGIAIRGLVNHPILFLLPVLQFGLSSLLQRILLPRDMILIGE